MPLLPASSTTIVPAAPSTSYEGWFLADLHTEGLDPNNVQASVTLRKAHQDSSTGLITFSPNGEQVQVSFGNLLANPDPNVQNAVQAVMLAVASQASTLGIQL